MFKLVFGRPELHRVLYQGSLEQCKERRWASGDIVIDSNNQVVQGDAWLWEWEKTNSDCYARKMQRRGWIY